MALVNELISQVLRRLDELDPDNPIHRTREEILVFVNDALTELNLIAWEFQDTLPVAVNPTDNVYDHSAEVIGAISIRSSRVLRKETVHDISMEADGNWEKPTAQRKNIDEWSPLGLDKFFIWPRPLVAQTVYVDAIVMHTPVTDSGASLPVKPEYENAIEDFCVQRATFKEGPSELNQSNELYTNFLNNVQRASGRSVIRLYPSYVSASLSDDNMRDPVESGEHQNDR